MSVSLYAGWLFIKYHVYILKSKILSILSLCYNWMDLMDTKMCRHKIYSKYGFRILDEKLLFVLYILPLDFSTPTSIFYSNWISNPKVQKIKKKKISLTKKKEKQNFSHINCNITTLKNLGNYKIW